MPFGLKTAGATFQRLMQATFSDFLMGNVTGSSDHQHGFCMPYVDDLIVRSISHVDLLEDYRRIFVPSSQLTLMYLVMSLLMVVFQTPRKSTRSLFSLWSIPSLLCRSSLEWSAFTGLTSHALLNGLTICGNFFKRTRTFTTQVEAEFNDLIAVLTGPDVLLHYPHWFKPFHVHTDASKLGVGAVLMQEDDQHCLRSLQYASQAFSPTQQSRTLANKNFMLSNGQSNNGVHTFWDANSSLRQTVPI